MEARINTDEIINIVDGEYDVPEKIYIPQNLTGIEDFWIDHKVFGDEIEYTRTDALIEKALKYLDENFLFNNKRRGIESGVFDSKKEMIEDFKKYMKGE